MDISEIISKLPIPAEKQEVLYDIFLQFVKHYSTSEETMQRLRQLFIDTAELGNENHPPISAQLDFQSRLNSVIDELWNAAEEEKYLEYQRLFGDLRELLRTLHEKTNTTQQELSEVRREVDLLRTEITNFNTSKGSLFLGSLSVQILIKIARFLNHEESLFNAMSYSVHDINNMPNIHLFKSFLSDHGHDWETLKKTIKMLKFNRLTAAHPGNSDTTGVEIEMAINHCFPNTCSEFHTKATDALNILRLLSNELNEPLFITMPYWWIKEIR